MSARASLLDYVDPNDMTMMFRPVPGGESVPTRLPHRTLDGPSTLAEPITKLVFPTSIWPAAAVPRPAML